jgi:CBS domain containing-hemolysin-like protein
METIFIIVAISLTGSFLCSLFEAALYSATPTRVEAQRRQGVWGAARLAKLRHGIEEPIAAILTVNTIANTMGATWAGALVGEHFGTYWVTWFAAAFTVTVLFFTEIVPKTLGVVHANTLGAYVAWPIQAMIWLVWPLAKLSVRLTKVLSRGKKPSGPTEEEILVMSDLALQAGKLLPEEQVLVKNALRLDQVKVHDLMTPRTVVEWLPARLTLAEAAARNILHSRIPVVEGDDLLQVTGLVHRRDLFDALARGEKERRVSEFLRPVRHVVETAPANRMLEEFLARREHLAMVVDEHGDIRGLLTLEDILEHLLGREIVDEYDEHADMQEVARRKARRRLRPEPS